VGIKWIAQITRILKKRVLELQIIFNLCAITHYPLPITHFSSESRLPANKGNDLKGFLGLHGFHTKGILEL